MPDSTLRELPSQHDWLRDGVDDPREIGPVLCIAWCLAEPERVGEVARVPRAGGVLGRGDAEATLFFGPERPGATSLPSPLQSRLISRRQLEIAREGEGLRVRNVGGRTLSVNGVARAEALVEVGAVLTLENQLVLVVCRRAAAWPEVKATHDFGTADADGMVGESPAAWDLRSQLDFLAVRRDPVLLLGPSGAGKERVAQALHRQSSRAGRLVSRNAATLPEGLVDAELFGSARGYPQAGMPERAGLIGQADRGTLFLDEVGEMPEPIQAHLLRVLDAGGEYQRLGEARTRRSDFRCVAATNRPLDALKHDLLARFTHRISLPGLDARVEDIPLMVAFLLAEAAEDPALAERFFDGPHARITPGLIEALLRHPWTTHVRELRGVLWVSLQTSTGRALALTSEVRARLSPPTEPTAATDPAELDEARVRAALEQADGSVTGAARALGLSSRYTLYRVMRKLGIEG